MSGSHNFPVIRAKRPCWVDVFGAYSVCVCVGGGGWGLEVLVLGRNDPDLDGLMEM